VTPNPDVAATHAYALAEGHQNGVGKPHSSKGTYRERLLKNGFIQEVMKGWHIPARPGERAEDSTAWYASFWDFCAAYLRARFDNEWCLSPEQSLSLHGGNRAVPRQLLVRTSKGGNKPTSLLHGTSI
jgi:hypothetical protein